MSKQNQTITVNLECEPWAALAAVDHIRQAARRFGLEEGLVPTCQLSVAVDLLEGSDLEGFKRALAEMSLADTFEVTQG